MFQFGFKLVQCLIGLCVIVGVTGEVLVVLPVVVKLLEYGSLCKRIKKCSQCGDRILVFIRAGTDIR